jgi:hypothetical protein
MKNNRQAIQAILPVFFLALLFLQASCTHINLEDYPETGPVNITFDWSKLTAGDSLPAAMKLYFYGDNGVLSYDCNSNEFCGSLPDGNYQVIAYNTDAKGVTFNGTDTYTGTQANVTEQNETKAVTYLSQPIHAYGIGLGKISVYGDSTVNEKITPYPFVKKIQLKYIITGNRTAVLSCSSILTGLALSVNIATGKPSGNTGAISFTPTSTNEGFESIITAFGISDTSPKTLSSVIRFTSGGSQTIDLDIASALAGVNDAVIPIEVNLNIAVTETVQGDFGATLTGWTYDTQEVNAE